MRILLATRALDWIGGSETYLITVAEQLERLGHHVVVHASRLGTMAKVAGARGLRVHASLDEVGELDAGLVQDGAVAYQVAARFPGIPLVFVAHSDAALQSPPQLTEVCPVAVALNDRIAAHLRALGSPPRVARLRQPIDLSRFGPLSMTHPRARRALAFGNHFPARRRELIAAACERSGLELAVLGLPGLEHTSTEPERELSRAEVVIAVGRCALEGMASGNAVYVYGPLGGDGWVTDETYPAIEADGFSGRATDLVVDSDRLAADLAAYSFEHGQRNRDLAAAHHDALAHARALVALWSEAGATAPPPSAADELARLVRLQRQAEETSTRFARESQRSRLNLERFKVRAQAREQKLRQRIEALESSRRYRLGSALVAPLDALRRRRRGGDGASSGGSS